MPVNPVNRIPVIDSHTCGEPTRVVIGGVEDPEGGSMREKREAFARDLDWLRTATVCEPRGHDALVGALLCDPVEPNCETGVIFFNNVGVLNGCLHGTMGVAATLLSQGKFSPGTHQFDTPTGVVTVFVGRDGVITVRNIRSFRFQKEVEVEVPGQGNVSGDVAWGGNWFFLTEAPGGMAVNARNIETLTAFSRELRQALQRSGVTGEDGAEIDHIELFGPPADPAVADSKNFVLCPGKAYDRSPCGTGTSAKLACLHADGVLKTGEAWRQAGILDTVFQGTVESSDERGVIPCVTGSAFITARAELIIDPNSPFAFGIPELPGGPL